MSIFDRFKRKESTQGNVIASGINEKQNPLSITVSKSIEPTLNDQLLDAVREGKASLVSTLLSQGANPFATYSAYNPEEGKNPT